MELLVLKKETPHKHLKNVTEYLIANGPNMGRWTLHFGVHCLADTPDTISYLKYQHKENDGSIIEIYTLTKKE